MYIKINPASGEVESGPILSEFIIKSGLTWLTLYFFYEKDTNKLLDVFQGFFSEKEEAKDISIPLVINPFKVQGTLPKRAGKFFRHHYRNFRRIIIDFTPADDGSFWGELRIGKVVIVDFRQRQMAKV